MRSAVITTVALMFARTHVGKMEASTIRSPSSPWTFPVWSVTASASADGPIRHVEVGWKVPRVFSKSHPFKFASSSSAASDSREFVRQAHGVAEPTPIDLQIQKAAVDAELLPAD